ncbi:histidine triad nucleotide-binding protein [Candidatus Peregrinibacteria bacterium]|nr:histidine triad nucleotide-binding protein [Candidatus Peregrinibacteria bacterium]
MNDCIFCKITNKKLPAKIQYEDELCMAFNDIHPKDRIHILVIPKKHIPTIAYLEDGDEKLMGHLIKIAKELAKKNGCPGYRLTFFVGKEGGQEVFHVHLHLIGK